jgi:hypothetical protein
MWIISAILLTLLSTPTWALEAFEKINNVKILRALPENILLMDRGIEDGISRNDHAKLTSDTEGFIGRAICVRATASTSYWKLYRIPNAEVVSLDMTYSIVGLADREIPFPTAKLRDKKLDFVDPAPLKTTTPPDPFVVKRDLPEKLTERDLIEATGPDRQKLFIERAINKDQIKRDLQDYRFSLYASPFARQSINNGETIRYGVRGGNIASRYRVLMQFEQQQSQMTDPFTKESVSTSSTQGQAQFFIHRIKPWLSSLSLINYNSTRFSDLGTPDSQWQVGPLGFTWHLYESKTWEYLDLSYIPLYDIRRTDTFEPNGNLGSEKTNGLRHGVRFAMKSRINERVAFENILWVRPYQDPSTWEIEADNLNLMNDLKLIFNLSGNFFFDYNLVYQKDKLWKTLNGLPESNVINSLNVRYDFDL